MGYYESGEDGFAGGFFWSREVDRRFWRVVPFADHAVIFRAAKCVTDDFGNLVRVPS